jgi:hypothetical protein
VTLVDPTVLIGAIVRQTTVLLAQIATGLGPGERATLAQTANQVFASLVGELRSQGVGTKGIADMFGLTLRTFHHRLSRATESRTERGTSLWDALLAFVGQRGSVSRPEILDRFRADEDKLVRGVLRELVDAGLVFRSGTGSTAFFRVARVDEVPEPVAENPIERLASLVWVAVKRAGPIGLRPLLDLVPAPEVDVERALAHLVATDRIEERTSDAGVTYFAEEFLIPVGDTAGWEAAVFDHYQALVTTITTKLRVAGRTSAVDDWIGGSTYSVDLDRDHPLFDEVVGFLRSTRERAVALRARVAEVNRSEGRGAHGALKVVMYVGQTVLGAEGDLEG